MIPIKFFEEQELLVAQEAWVKLLRSPACEHLAVLDVVSIWREKFNGAEYSNNPFRHVWLMVADAAEKEAKAGQARFLAKLKELGIMA